jgi:hypothetical protein
MPVGNEYSVVNRPHAFKHRDVVRIVKAARAAGVNVDQVTVDPHTGKITVAQGENAPATPNAWDEVLSTDAEDAKRSA